MMLSELQEDERPVSIEEFAISQMISRNLEYYENNQASPTETPSPDTTDSSSPGDEINKI